MKILLADDHELIRRGLKEVIISRSAGEWQIEEVASLPAATERLSACQDIELLLLDLYLPGSSGLDGLMRLKRAFPALSVVIISSEEAPQVVADAIRYGASGYIPKSTSNEVMLKAIELVVSGGVYVPRQALSGQFEQACPVSAAPLQHAGEGSMLDQLNEMQKKIAELVAQGMSNREIADQTGFALQTVKNHVSRILRVLKLDSRTSLALMLARRGSRPRPDH